MYQITEFSIYFLNFRFSILNDNLSDNLYNRLLEWQSWALSSLYLLISLVLSWLVLLFTFAFSNVIVYHLVQLKKRTNTINGIFTEIAIVTSLSCLLFPYKTLESISIFFTSLQVLYSFLIQVWQLFCLVHLHKFVFFFSLLLCLLLPSPPPSSLCYINISVLMLIRIIFKSAKENRMILIVLKKKLLNNLKFELYWCFYKNSKSICLILITHWEYTFLPKIFNQ